MPLRAWLLVIFLIALAISLYKPYSWRDMSLEHIPTLAALIPLIYYGRRRPLADSSYILILIFLLFHVLGAHYLYSNVPYDRWATTLTGHDITNTFGLSRNHYDRLVHFLWGLLLVPPAADMAVRFAKVRPGFWAAVFAIGFISIGGCIYEVIEFLITLILSIEDAEAYNGQQGDVFDPQKDLALNFIGSVFSGFAVTIIHAIRHPRARV